MARKFTKYNEFVFEAGDSFIPLRWDSISLYDDKISLPVYGTKTSKRQQREFKFIGLYPVKDARKKFL